MIQLRNIRTSTNAYIAVQVIGRWWLPMGDYGEPGLWGWNRISEGVDITNRGLCLSTTVFCTTSRQLVNKYQWMFTDPLSIQSYGPSSKLKFIDAALTTPNDEEKP